MPDRPELRVSDQDRERAVRELRDHFAAGRLAEDELTERVDAAYEARTQGQLGALTADLPRLPATKAEERTELARRRGELQRQVLQQSGGALVPFAICTVIWLTSGASGMFWPIWVALFALIPLLRNGWRLYGPSPDLERVEQDVARRKSRAQGQDAHPGRHRHSR